MKVLLSVLAFGVLAVLLVAGAIWLMVATSHDTDDLGTSVPVTVIDTVERPGTQTDPQRSVHVEYEYEVDGARFRAETSFSARSWGSGSQVVLCVDPAAPEVSNLRLAGDPPCGESHHGPRVTGKRVG